MVTTAQVYRELYKQWPKYLYLFPLIAGSAWFVTLSVLLVYWLAKGRPTYPKQANPYVPFISDIAAWNLKPFFITGCIITSVTFLGTVISVHYARHSHRYYRFPGSDSKWRQATSIFTLLAGIIASISLLFLSIFDTAHAHLKHRFLLSSTFIALGLSALGTGLIWVDAWFVFGKKAGKRRERIGHARRSQRLRVWAMINFGIMLVIACLGVAFFALQYFVQYRPAGILEWVISFVGCFWLLSFVPFFTPKDEDQKFQEIVENEHATGGQDTTDDSDDDDGNDERRPLLTDR